MRGFFIQIYKHLSFHTNYIFLSKKVIILQAYDVVLKSELALHLKAIFENKKYKMFHKIPNSIKLSINLKTNKNKPKMSIFIKRQRCFLTFTAKNSSKVSTLFIIIIQYLSITALILNFVEDHYSLLDQAYIAIVFVQGKQIGVSNYMVFEKYF